MSQFGEVYLWEGRGKPGYGAYAVVDAPADTPQGGALIAVPEGSTVPKSWAIGGFFAGFALGWLLGHAR